MDWFLLFAVYGGLLFGVYKLAEYKNRVAIGYVLASFIFQPLLVILILAILPKLDKKSSGDGNFRVEKKKKKKEEEEKIISFFTYFRIWVHRHLQDKPK